MEIFLPRRVQFPFIYAASKDPRFITVQERLQAPVEKLPPPPSKGGLAKNLYTKAERMTVSCRVTSAWSERVNLYNRQKMILPRNIKTYAT
jgi:hypothetical protein